MDLAPEPMLDAFTPPPTRAAPARAPVADDNGQSFDDHLDAVSEAAPAATVQQAREVVSTDATPALAEDSEIADEVIDPELALLGGPLPPTPPPMAAPVAAQIAASQPQTEAPPQTAEAEMAPGNTPQTEAPFAPALQEQAQAAEPVAPKAPATARDGDTEVRHADASAPQAPITMPSQGVPAQPPQAPSAQHAAANAQATIEPLPPAIQQAMTAIVPAPQAPPQTAASRVNSKATMQTAEAQPNAREGKVEAPAADAKPAKSAVGDVKIDVAPPPQTQSGGGDAPQFTYSSTPSPTATQASTHVQHAAVETGAQRAAPAPTQIGREIIRRFDGGATNFELRLDPAELGRVEVRMEVTRDHRVTAVITADNPQALTELVRHARDLEQQLQSAGLQLSDNGLSFDLRQGAQGSEGEENAGARGGGREDAANEQQQAAPMARPIGYERWRGVRVDMMV